VTVAKPERKTVHRIIELPGRVEASEQAALFSRVTGHVQKVSVDLGDHVKTGQLLVELAVPDLQAEFKEKAALVALAEAEVEHARGTVKTAEAALVLATAQVQEAEAGVKRAKATQDLRKAEYQRVKELQAAKAVDQQVVAEKLSQFEAARGALEEAEAKVKSAQATREESAVKSETVKADVKAAMARLDVARARVQRAETALQYAKITAPFDGVVTRRTADPGTLAVPPGAGKAAPLLVVAKIDSVRIVIEVPERDVPLVSVGTPATIHIDALKGQELTGKVSRMAGALQPNTGILRAEIDLPNPKGKILPGMFARVSLTLDEVNAWTLPSRAVGARDGQFFCYRVEAGKAIRTPIRVGFEANGLVVVLKKQTKPARPGGEPAWEDFTGDEQIVTSDLGKLKDGQVVRVGPGEKPKPEEPPAKEGGDVKKLTQARLEAARKTYEMLLQRYKNATDRLDTEKMYQWSRRWMEAGRDLASKQDERVAAVQAHLDRMKDLERLATALSKAGQGLMSDVSAAEFYRTEAELWLAREKGK
jgi:RND family efflux transporter MFP subunit